MDRKDIVNNIINAMIKYDIEYIDNIFKEAEDIADYLIERNGDNLTIEEINKCVHNRYDGM